MLPYSTTIPSPHTLPHTQTLKKEKTLYILMSMCITVPHMYPGDYRMPYKQKTFSWPPPRTICAMPLSWKHPQTHSGFIPPLKPSVNCIFHTCQAFWQPRLDLQSLFAVSSNSNKVKASPSSLVYSLCTLTFLSSSAYTSSKTVDSLVNSQKKMHFKQYQK